MKVAKRMKYNVWWLWKEHRYIIGKSASRCDCCHQIFILLRHGRAYRTRKCARVRLLFNFRWIVFEWYFFSSFFFHSLHPRHCRRRLCMVFLRRASLCIQLGWIVFSYFYYHWLLCYHQANSVSATLYFLELMSPKPKLPNKCEIKERDSGKEGAKEIERMNVCWRCHAIGTLNESHSLSTLLYCLGYYASDLWTLMSFYIE